MKKQTQKRLIMSILTIFLLSIFMNPFTKVEAAAAAPNIDAKYAILIDANSGRVLYEKNADLAAPIASMSKMMTEYLVLEAIDKGDITWETTTQITEFVHQLSANVNSSGVGLRLDHDYTVKELYEAMAIYSDNATTITLAQLLGGGSEGKFVQMMNEKAAELGLKDYQFINSTGLPNDMLGDNRPEGTPLEAENMLSAESVALLAYSLIRDYPEALEISSIPQLEFYGQKLDNWNWMLKHDPKESPYYVDYYYEGMDGLKTGTTPEAGYCFTGTATRNGMRLISVVMGAESEPQRFKQTKTLLDYGFDNFETVEVFPEGYQLKDNETLKVVKGKEKSVEIVTNQPISIMMEKGDDKKAYKAKYTYDKKLVSKDGEVTAPIKKGEKIGSMTITYKGESELKFITQEGANSAKANVVTKTEVEKANWFVLMMRGIGGFFADIWSSVANTVKGWF